MQLDQLNPRKYIQIVCSQVCRVERGSGAGVTPNEDAAQTLDACRISVKPLFCRAKVNGSICLL